MSAQSEAVPYTPITLDDFAVEPVTIRLHTRAGRAIAVRIVPLTAAQWAEIGYEVESPAEPAQKNAATMRVYQKHAGQAEEERNMRRVVFAMEAGGNVIKGATLGDKAKNLRETADRGLIAAVYRFLQDAAEGDEASIVAASSAFSAAAGVHSSDV